MKKLILLLALASFAMTSCTSTQAFSKRENQVAGYTLKNKKELMQQKIADKKGKTVVATP